MKVDFLAEKCPRCNQKTFFPQEGENESQILYVCSNDECKYSTTLIAVSVPDFTNKDQQELEYAEAHKQFLDELANSIDPEAFEDETFQYFIDAVCKQNRKDVADRISTVRFSTNLTDRAKYLINGVFSAWKVASNEGVEFTKKLAMEGIKSWKAQG